MIENNISPGQWSPLLLSPPLGEPIKEPGNGSASESVNVIHFEGHGATARESTQPETSHEALSSKDPKELLVALLSSLISSLINILKASDKSESVMPEDNAMPGNGHASTPSMANHESAKNDATPSFKPDPSGQIAPGDTGMNAPQEMPPTLWKDCVDAGQKHGVDPYILAAMAKQESNFGRDLQANDIGKDGIMQVESATRQDYAVPFSQKTGHAYNHDSQSDKVEMAAVIISSQDGDEKNQLMTYNGGPNWQPGTTDSHGRRINSPEKYAESVLEIARQFRANDTPA